VTSDTATKRRPPTLAQREARLGWALILPASLVVLVLVLFPLLWNISMSFQRIRLIELQTFNFLDFSDASLKNYERVISVADFWGTLRTTILYALMGTILSIGLGMWAALISQKPFRGRSLVRGFMLFPYVAPVIAVTFVWSLMLNPTFGVINEWLRNLGFQQVDFLNRENFVLNLFGWEVTLPLALTMVILFEAWRYFPFAFLFIMARLQALPASLDEAAMVDGATMTQKFRYVTLPQLRGVLSVLFLLRFIWTFNKFDDIFLLTGGAAGTEVIPVAIVEFLRARADLGSAAALSILLAIILALLMLVYFKWFYTEEA